MSSEPQPFQGHSCLWIRRCGAQLLVECHHLPYDPTLVDLKMKNNEGLHFH